MAHSRQDSGRNSVVMVLAFLLALGAASAGVYYVSTNPSNNTNPPNNIVTPIQQGSFVRFISGGSMVGSQIPVSGTSSPISGDPITGVSTSGPNAIISFNYPNAKNGDLIAIYENTGSGNFVVKDWKFLNNSQSTPVSPVTSGSVTLNLAAQPAGSSNRNVLLNPTFIIPTDRDLSQKLGTFPFEQPKPMPKAPSICDAANVQFDDEGATAGKGNIFIALDPPNGQPVGVTRQLRAWVMDEAGGMFPNSAAADSNGVVTKHTNPAVDKDSHGYPWETAIYLTKITPENENGPYIGDKENGGTPIFQHQVKGLVRGGGLFISVPTHDDPAPYRIGTRGGHGGKIGEYIWNVDSLSLTPGNYRAQVALHDGDKDLAIECTTLIL